MSALGRATAHAFIELLGLHLPMPVIYLTDPCNAVLHRDGRVISPFVLVAWPPHVRSLIAREKYIIAIDVRVSDEVSEGFTRELRWIVDLGRERDTLLAVIGRESATDRSGWTSSDYTAYFIRLFARADHGLDRRETKLRAQFPHAVTLSTDEASIRFDGASDTLREAASLLMTAEHPMTRSLRSTSQRHQGWRRAFRPPNNR